jgi:hypothetical protein
MKLRKSLSIILLVLLSLAAPSLFAQEGTGGITGLVTDPQGAVVPGAQVVATNVDTQVRTVTATNSAGVYDLLNLMPGKYSVEVSSTNFKKTLRTNILVQVADHIGLNFKLEIGSFNETMTVTTQAPQLRTEDAQTGEVVTENIIESLPQVANGPGGIRDPLRLLSLAGDVQGDGSRAGWQLGASVSQGIFAGPADTRINGGRAAGVEYLVDGVPVTGGFIHQVATATPTTDDIQEFKVITNGISAEFGRLSGGAVEIATKSGTNAIHGQLFEYHQDAFLNANSWGNDNKCAAGVKSACAKSNFRRNDFGFALGGPVRIPYVYNGKNKTFWFANAEWNHESQSGNANVFDTITDLQRNSVPDPFNGNAIKTPTPCPDGTVGGCADLTDIGLYPYVDDSTTPFPYAALGDPFIAPSTSYCGPSVPPGTLCRYPSGGDGRHIPIAELSPAILHYISLMPHETNKVGLVGPIGGNYVFRAPEVNKDQTWSVRGDHAINDKQRIYGRFSHDSHTDVSGAPYPNYGAPSAALNGAFAASIHFSDAISSTLVLDLNAGGSYTPATFGTLMPSSFKGTQGWGFASDVTSIMGNALLGVGQGPRTEGTSSGSEYGAGTYKYGILGQSFNQLNSTNFTYSVALTKILNRHTMKFGYEARRYYDNFSRSAGASPTGNGDGFDFVSNGNGLLFGNDNTWSKQGDANSVGDFLWGVDSWTQATAATNRALASNYYAAYLQDDYKLSKRLTVNLGVRWEMQTPVTERHNNISIWDPLAPAPFTINQGYSWTGALAAAGLTPTQISQVKVPDWYLNQSFPSGAVEFTGTPEHRARTATDYHPWNFSPRLGFAYQARPNTVVRGSFSILYIPSGGNITNYGDTPGVAFSTYADNSGQQPQNWTYGQGLQTIEDPWINPTIELNTFSHNNQRANLQTAQQGNGTGGILISSHPPHEFNWSFGVQQQLPKNWLLEVNYAGNNSNTLYGAYIAGGFPRSLYVPANSSLYTNTQVASPTAGQIPGGGKTGATQPLGLLEFGYPYFGPTVIQGANVGTSHFESVNFRLNRRFTNGLQVGFNYTLSKALDDVGSANESINATQGTQGSNGKAYQQVLPISSVYGLSAGDQTHRINAFYNYELPFGRGRRWMSSRSGVGSNVLDAVAGGWQISGQTNWHSGTPASINVNNTNVDQSIDVFYINGSVPAGGTARSLITPGFSDPHSVVCATGCTSTTRAFVQGAPQNAASFTIGNLPPVLPFFRNPRAWTTDISILKRFPVLTKDNARYFQLRLDGSNIFNHAGLGSYVGDVNSGSYGQITGPINGNGERHIQIGGQFVF